jgi:1-deoxy-D-xylulose-5-phosphate synthase
MLRSIFTTTKRLPWRPPARLQTLGRDFSRTEADMTLPPSSLLETINSPADLRRLDRAALGRLSEELRGFVLHAVSRTGGHLSSNLGTVELTIALHHVFNTPHDRLVWDVGHQSYPHKILTGRRREMDKLRQFQGISGFPRRSESEYDTFGTAHSSTSISAALGMAVASRNLGEGKGPGRRRHVAIIGDGAMSAGMAFEALNNAGVTPDIDLLVILNDNDMSISPAVGAMNRYLARVLSARPVTKARDVAMQMLSVMPPVYELAKRLEGHAKGMMVPATFFEELGFTYFGPIDGHDLDSLLPTLQNLRRMSGPIFLHVITRKGQGYKLAEADPVLYHGPGKFDPAEGIKAAAASGKPTYTSIFPIGSATWPRSSRGWWPSLPPCAKVRAWSSSKSGFRSGTSTSVLPSSTRLPSRPGLPARA